MKSIAAFSFTGVLALVVPSVAFAQTMIRISVSGPDATPMPMPRVPAVVEANVDAPAPNYPAPPAPVLVRPVIMPAPVVMTPVQVVGVPMMIAVPAGSVIIVLPPLFMWWSAATMSWVLSPTPGR